MRRLSSRRRPGDGAPVHRGGENLRSLKRACELLKVSRAAFYARRTGTPGPRAVRDAEVEELRKERDQALAAVRRCEADLAAQRNITQALWPTTPGCSTA